MVHKVVCADKEYLFMNNSLHYDFAILHNGCYFTDPGINIHNFDGRQGLCFLNQLLCASESYDLVGFNKNSALFYGLPALRMFP